MRAVEPVESGIVERDGVRIGFERFGAGERTILLAPTWTIVHSRFWKLQVAYLSRHFRVVTYDGPGNGMSDRSLDPERYTAEGYAADAQAVLERCGVDRAVAVGVSLGAQYVLALEARDPAMVAGMVMIGSALPLVPPSPDRASIHGSFLQPYPADVEGWGKYNLAYWRDHYRDFTEFFFAECLSEPHSTKPIEDAISWAGATGPDVLAACEAADDGFARDLPTRLAAAGCPTLVIHGTADRLHPHARGVEAARLSGGSMLTMQGSGHLPNLRDPVRVNRAIHRFVEQVW